MQKVYCLNCLTPNSLDNDTCTSCGLPLPVNGSVSKHGFGDSEFELQQRERIEILESRVLNLSNTVEELLRYIHSFADGYDSDLESIDDLSEYISESNTQREAVEEFWQNSLVGYLKFVENRYQYQRKAETICSLYDGKKKHLFSKLIERAQIHFYGRQHKRCLKLIERALRMSPDNYELLFFLGEKLYLMNQSDKAMSCWSQVLGLKPDHYRAALMCGILKLMSGKTTDARNLLNEATRNCNDGIVPLLALATLEYQEGSLKESERYSNLANKIYETAFAHVLLAETFNQSSRPKKAVTALEKAALLKPNDKKILIRLASQYLNLGFNKLAKETFSRVSMLSPQEKIFEDLASKNSTPEMLAAFRNNQEYNPSNFLMHSVSDLLINELE